MKLDLDVALSCIFLIPKEVRHLLKLHALSGHPCVIICLLSSLSFGDGCLFHIETSFLKNCTTPSEGYTILYSMHSQHRQKSVLGE